MRSAARAQRILRLARIACYTNCMPRCALHPARVAQMTCTARGLPLTLRVARYVHRPARRGLICFTPFWHNIPFRPSHASLALLHLCHRPTPAPIPAATTTPRVSPHDPSDFSTFSSIYSLQLRLASHLRKCRPLVRVSSIIIAHTSTNLDLSAPHTKFSCGLHCTAILLKPPIFIKCLSTQFSLRNPHPPSQSQNFTMLPICSSRKALVIRSI